MIIPFEDKQHIVSKNYKFLYLEVRKLGAGSFGEVFEAKQKKSEQIKAIKKIIIKKDNEKVVWKELEIIRSIEKIKHKNIVKYEDFWFEKNDQKLYTLYIVMELCEQTLSEFIETFDTLDFGEMNSKLILKYYISSAIFTDILEGVNYLHKYESQIIHRDLKPDNILLKFDVKRKEFFIKIADFGLATIHHYVEQLHEADKGPMRYAAPEALDSEVYDTKSDIYSLGIILERDLFDIDYDDE
jgi:serine/threonine protein kinase